MDRPEAVVRAPSSILPLDLENVTFVAGGRAIVDAISCEIGIGARTIIVGPNGAGKSVLLRLCHGLLAPTSGRVVWRGSGTRDVHRHQAMVFQRPVMLRRSALGNLTYALARQDVPGGERIRLAREAMERVGLGHLADHPARVLSGGEQQRLALARAWALRPQVLFLDEPTASLDPSAAREIEAAILAIHATGTKIVMTTHNLGQARRLGDEILFLNQGRLAECAPAERFFAAPATAEAAAFIRGELPWT
jgi:tungstate transport system ATP-binding protein